MDREPEYNLKARAKSKFVRCVPLLLSIFALAACMPAKGVGQRITTPPRKTRILVERFTAPFADWRKRFFYRWTNAENYYAVHGGYKNPDHTAQQVGGFYIAQRGLQPKPHHRMLTISVKPTLGREISYFAIKLQTHFRHLSVTLIDSNGRRLIQSCAPYRKGYTVIAARLNGRGLKSIIFKSDKAQVSGNLHVKEVVVAYGPPPSWLTTVVHEWTGTKCVVTGRRVPGIQ